MRLEVAYDLLTRQAYAVWVRMMVEPEAVLERSGMEQLAERFRYRQRAFYNVVQELRDKGFIRVISPPRLGEPSAVILSKRALLVGRDHFIKLS